MAQQLSTGTFTLTPWIVSLNPTQGSYTTIQSAIDAANLAGGGTVYIQPGTYTENLTLKANVNLVANNLEGGVQNASLAFGVTAANVLINGNHTFTAASGIVIYGVAFTVAVGDIITITSTGAGSSIIALENCFLNSIAGRCVVVDGTAALSLIALFNTSVNSGTSPCIELKAQAFGSFMGAQFIANNVAFLLTGPGSQAQFVQGCSVTGQIQVADAASAVASNGTYFTAPSGISCITFTGAGSVLSYEDIFDSSNASGYYIDGTGTLSYGCSTTVNSATGIDPAITGVPRLTRPVATAGATSGAAVRGTASFNSVDFSIADGFVSLVGTPGTVWQTISASQTLAVDNGYICIAPGGALALLLPAASVVGDIIEVVLQGATSWQITQGAGQQVFIGNTSTTLGAGGSITSTAQGDAVRLVCSAANLTWVAVSGFIGNLTIV